MKSSLFPERTYRTYPTLWPGYAAPSSQGSKVTPYKHTWPPSDAVKPLSQSESALSPPQPIRTRPQSSVANGSASPLPWGVRGGKKLQFEFWRDMDWEFWSKQLDQEVLVESGASETRFDSFWLVFDSLSDKMWAVDVVVCRQAAATSPAGATGLRNPPQLPSSVLNPSCFKRFCRSL